MNYLLAKSYHIMQFESQTLRIY